MTAPDTIEAVRAALIARGWPDGGFAVTEDGAPVGQWQPFAAFTTNPPGTLVEVWAGPRAGAAGTGDIIVAGEPLTRARLRGLLAAGASRAVAQIVVKTAGAGRGIGDPLSGESRGLPVALEGKTHPPRVEDGPAGRRLAFYARMHSGAYARVHADIDEPAGGGPGGALVDLVIEPPGPGTGQPGPTAPDSGGPGEPPAGPAAPTGGPGAPAPA